MKKIILLIATVSLFAACKKCMDCTTTLVYTCDPPHKFCDDYNQDQLKEVDLLCGQELEDADGKEVIHRTASTSDGKSIVTFSNKTVCN